MIRLAAVALTLVALAVPAVEAAEVAGSWETSQGLMRITPRADGSYDLWFELFPGKATGTLDGNVMTGTWYRLNGAAPCPEPRDDKVYWGTFSIAFEAEGKFQGGWSFCDYHLYQVEPTGFKGTRTD